MISQEFRTNRLDFPEEELAKYRGQCVAFSPDGRQIVAHGESIEVLEGQLSQQAYQPAEVVLERVPEDDLCLGAEGF